MMACQLARELCCEPFLRDFEHMWELITENALVAVYLAILSAVAMFGFHRYVLVYLYLKHRHDGYQPKGKFEELPKVTVQLPMFNEDFVAERIIRASCQI